MTLSSAGIFRTALTIFSSSSESRRFALASKDSLRWPEDKTHGRNFADVDDSAAAGDGGDESDNMDGSDVGEDDETDEGADDNDDGFDNTNEKGGKHPPTGCSKEDNRLDKKGTEAGSDTD
jgi:hypothetical protein